MDDITQQNAALAEQAAAGSIAMSEQSASMSKLLNFFKVSSKGNSAPVKTTARSKASATPIAPPKPMKTASYSKPKNDDTEWEEF